MNTFLKSMIGDRKPKIENMSEREKHIYEAGLGILAGTVTEDFFDIGTLPEDRFSTDGIFYEICYYDSETLWSSGNQRTLVVIYEVKARSSWCPLRIDFQLIDIDNMYLYAYKQDGNKPAKRVLLGKDKGDWVTEIPDYGTITLSKLLEV